MNTVNTHNLYFQEIEDCEQVRVVTTDEDYDIIGEINQDVVIPELWSVRRWSISYSNNCCPPTLINVHVNYDLETALMSCILDQVTNYLDIKFDIAGIRYQYVAKVEISEGPTGAWTLIPHTTRTIGHPNGFSIALPSIHYTSVQFPITRYVKITHVDGFEYVIEYRIVQDLDKPCGADYLTISTTYPELDPRIVIQQDGLGNNYILLTDLFEQDIMQAGVHQVIMCRHEFDRTVCIQNHVFLKCDLICRVINKLVQCRDSDIMFFYDALVMSNLCPISYQDVCALYELFYYKLTNDGCYNPFEDCNCADCHGGTSFVQRRANPINTTKQCGPCTS